MSVNCDLCGYRDNEVKSGSAISAKGRKITLKVEDRDDLSRDILKVTFSDDFRFNFRLTSRRVNHAVLRYQKLNWCYKRVLSVDVSRRSRVSSIRCTRSSPRKCSTTPRATTVHLRSFLPSSRRYVLLVAHLADGSKIYFDRSSPSTSHIL